GNTGQVVLLLGRLVGVGSGAVAAAVAALLQESIRFGGDEGELALQAAHAAANQEVQRCQNNEQKQVSNEHAISGCSGLSFAAGEWREPGSTGAITGSRHDGMRF